MEPFILTLVFQFLDLDPVCRSHSLSACFSVPQEPHLHTTLQTKRKVNLHQGGKREKQKAELD